MARAGDAAHIASRLRKLGPTGKLRGLIGCAPCPLTEPLHSDILPAPANGHRMRFDQLKRRDFITLLGGAVAWPLVARAQQPARLPVVGALVIGNIDPQQFWREFRQGLRDLGYVEGQNIRFEFRSAEGRDSSRAFLGRAETSPGSPA